MSAATGHAAHVQTQVVHIHAFWLVKPLMLTHRRSCLWQSSDSYQTAISDGHFEAGCSTPYKHGCSPETRSNSCTDVSSHSWFKGCCRFQAVCTQNTPRPIAERVLLGHGRAARPSSTHLRAAQSGRIKEVEVRRLHLSLPNKSTVDMKGGRLHLHDMVSSRKEKSFTCSSSHCHHDQQWRRPHPVKAVQTTLQFHSKRNSSL